MKSHEEVTIPKGPKIPWGTGLCIDATWAPDTHQSLLISIYVISRPH